MLHSLNPFIILPRGVVSNLSQMGDIQHYKFMITTAPYDWHEIFIKSGGAADKARNSNVSSNKIIIYTDKIHPSVVLSSPETNPTNEDSFRAFLTFSEKTYGIDSTDFYLQKCKVSNLYTEDSILFSFNIHPLVNGIISMNLPAGVGADHIGNLNTASLFYSIEYDTIRPRMTIYSPTGNFQHAEFTARFKFDETVQGFGDTSISIINGTFKNFTMSASQTEWQVTVVPNKIGEVIVSARENAVLDKAGNRSTKPTDLIVSYNNDSFQPKVVLSSNTPSPTASSEIEVIMTFSEPVFGLTISKIRTQNATVSNLRMIENDSLWSVKVYPGTDGYIKIWLDAQTVYDAAQNYSTASNTLTWLVDLSAPGLNISTTAPDTGNIQQISVRFVFTEEITGLDSSDLKCTNMNLVSLTSSSTLVYSAIFQIIADGDASIWVTEQSVIDLVGNANTPSNVIQLYYDGTRPQAFISSYHAKDTIYTDTLTIRVTFSEKIDGFSFNNLQLFNAQVVGMNYDPVLKAYDITLQALDSLQFGITAKVPSGVSYDKWNNPNLASDVYVKYLNFGPNAINSRDLPPGWRIGSGYEVIRIESPAHNGNAQLEIFDLQMRSILSYQMESSETKNIQIMNGVYFIRITQDKFEYGKMLIVR